MSRKTKSTIVRCPAIVSQNLAVAAALLVGHSNFVRVIESLKVTQHAAGVANGLRIDDFYDAVME